MTTLGPGELAAQSHYLSAHVEAAATTTGLGAALTAEVGVRGPVRLGLRWIDTQAIAACAVDDAPDECNADPSLWEVGVRTGIAPSARIAPFIGAGTGVYRRTARVTRDNGTLYLDDPERHSSPFLSIIAGLDIAVAGPVSVRISASHHEVFDRELSAVYGHRVRLSGIFAGVGIATW